MKNLAATVFLFAFLFITIAVLNAQSIRSISTNDGLPQSFVSGIIQDDSSFIWIGTRNGLARYDGINFKTFRHDPDDTTTIASNLIIWIRKDNSNNTWIEYETGDIDRFNPVTETVRHFLKGNLAITVGIQFVRRGWLVDDDGIFWGITQGKGLNYYDPSNKKIVLLTKKNSALPSDTVRGIINTKNEGLWLVTNNAISLYNKKTNQFTNYKIPYPQDYGAFEGSDAIAVDLHLRKNGELMWGDRRNMYFFNTATHNFRAVPMPEITYLGARWIRSDSKGVDYFENYGKVYRYDDNAGIIKAARTSFSDSGGVKSFLVDRSGLLWLGADAEGIQQIDLATPLFTSYKYKKDFVSDMMQQVFNKNAFQLFNLTPKDILFAAPGYHLRSAYDKNNRLYIALKQSVYYYDTLQNKYIKLPEVPLLAAGQFGITIKGISFMADGSPVVVEYTGAVLIYNAATKSWKPFIEPSFIRQNFGAAVLPQDIYADNKNIWITTATDGLLKIDITTKRVQQLNENKQAAILPTNQLLGLEPDPTRSNLLWVGSFQGLICLNKNTLQCQVFSLKEGLPDNTVYALMTDHSGKLWFSTNKGICQFDPISHRVKVFRAQNGLPGDEFNRFHNLALPNGMLVFGGVDGWTIFNPLLMKEDAFEPGLAFTGIKINNRDTLPANLQSLINKPLNATGKLVLPFEQNTLSISYAGLEYNQPGDIQYRYKLDGYDKDWVYAGNKREAIYTKLPPGKYTLLANASNTSGKWSSHIKTLEIEVNAPWWGTKLAYLCYAIIIGGLVWTFIRFRVNREVMKQEIDLKEKESAQLRELDDIKTKFFSNITHELRTPLTLIMGPAEQLKTKATDAQQKNLADTVVSNAKQLLTLINRLLDLSKLEAKALKLAEQKANPSHIVGAIVHSFENEAATKNISLYFQDNTTKSYGWFYADAVERILYNLVSNALKFTQPGGIVSVLLADENERLELAIKDNGVGIAKDKQPLIFNRFYQVDNAGGTTSNWHTGTGIGLALVNELINQCGGTINVQSNTTGELKGTTFTVTLPFRKIEAAQTEIITETDSGIDKTAVTDDVPLILLVEDNAALAGFIKSILNDNYRLLHVLNGAAGLEAALQQMPDLILSDVMMPVMDGYEMCRRLKEDMRTSHIPVILLTAKVSQENVLEGLSKGADDYLTKPFHPTELSLRINNLLDRQKKLQALYRQEQVSIPKTGTVTAPAVQDIFLARFYEQLDEHLDDVLFSVDQLAEKLFISRSSLHRKLKTLTGFSTTEVVRNYRLKRAAEFLKEGHSSSDAAYKSGFGSPAYFSKNFKEVYGITPGEYVKKVKSQQ